MAAEAGEDFGNVTVIDSGHISSGLGLMAIEAAILAGGGMEPGRIVELLERMKEHVHTSFIVSSLDFLTRQKLLPDWIRYLTDALLAHPVIALKNGNMIIKRFYFGSRERAWKKYLKSAFRVPGTIDRRILFITYVGMTTRELEKIQGVIETMIKFDQVYIQKAAPATAVNCGPGTFGLLFFTEY